MSRTRQRVASWLRLLGYMGFYGGIFLLPVMLFSEIAYGHPAPSRAEVLLACSPALAILGIGLILLVVSHKVDPSAGADREDFGHTFRTIASLTLFIAGILGITGALLTETIDALGSGAQITPTSYLCAIVFVMGIVFLWLSRRLSGNSGPVQRYPLDEIRHNGA